MGEPLVRAGEGSDVWKGELYCEEERLGETLGSDTCSEAFFRSLSSLRFSFSFRFLSRSFFRSIFSFFFCSFSCSFLSRSASSLSSSSFSFLSFSKNSSTNSFVG